MTTWTVVAVVVIAVILLAWIANAYRLAKKNNNVGRRSPGMRHQSDVDEQNRSVEERRRTES